MRLVLVINAIFAVIFCVLDLRYIWSFEVAFIGAFCIIFLSYKSIMQKVESLSGMEANVENKHFNRLNMGLKTFFTKKIFAYIALGLGAIVLINNSLFFYLPFLSGVFIASICAVIWAIHN